jgi:peptidoglycan/LPS O-acetylase OafA/YrhL
LKNSLHLKGLNGIRAIAALGVVLSHITLKLGNFNLNPFVFGEQISGQPEGLRLAGFGVSMFFCLSGFLITYLLLLEKQRTSINIKNFYLRRILRIWPIYYLYMAICFCLIVSLGIYFNWGSLLLYIFYAANVPFILNQSLPFLDHFWSLGVEEQFYSFWPWVVKKIDRLLFISYLMLGTLLVAKIFFRFCFGDTSIPYLAIHVTRFHCMLIGAIGAIHFQKKSQYFLSVATHKATQIIAWLSIFLVIVNKFHVASVLDNELISLVALIIIIGQITETNRIINLEKNFFDFIGKISYGIYVYHPIIIFGASFLLKDIYHESLLKYIIVYISIVALTILTAYCSYEFFEKWFLKRKLKYSTIETHSSNG